MAPYDIDQSAPYIFDADGVSAAFTNCQPPHTDCTQNLVWCGYGQGSTADGHDFQLVTINNETRLAFFIGTEVNGFGRGHGAILDNSYRTLTSIYSGNGKASIDMHELNIVEGGETALVSIYQPVPYDLSAYNVSGLGWVNSGTFQEVNITSGEVLFEWSSIDHVDLSESFKDIGSMGSKASYSYDYL